VAEGDHPHLRGGEDGPDRVLLQPPLGQLRQFEAARHGRAEGVDAVMLQAHPELQRAEGARQFEPAVAEVDLGVEPVDIVHVGGNDAEDVDQPVLLAHQQAAEVEGLEEPLVRIERERIAQLEPGQRGAALRAEDRGSAEGGVGVEPEAVPAAERRERAEIVHRARAGGPGVGDDAEGGRVGGQGGLQRADLQPAQVI